MKVGGRRVVAEGRGSVDVVEFAAKLVDEITKILCMQATRWDSRLEIFRIPSIP